MKDIPKRQWFLLRLHWFLLLGGLIDSSSLSSPARLLSVSYKVGSLAVLPCSWTQRLGPAAAAAPCHVLWTAPEDTVFELDGDRRWQAEDLEGRAEVPRERLGSGDCSLIIRDVQVGDSGTYEGFMVVDGQRDTKTRVFIQSVRLSVSDHRSYETRGPGEDLVLDLHTNHSMRVVFYGSNSSEWTVLWMRGEPNSERLQKHPQEEQLTVKTLGFSDRGTYKVLDEYGLTVSTVQLAVTENSQSVRLQQTQEAAAPTGGAARTSCSLLLLLLLLLSSSQSLRLL